MSRKVPPLLPSTQDGLRQFGQSLKLARLRRNLTAKQVSERTGMAPMTLRQVERGSYGVTIGAYLAAMQVLGIEKEFLALAQHDAYGHELQDARLLKSRVYRKKPSAMSEPGGLKRLRKATSSAQPPRAFSSKGMTTVEELEELLATTKK